MNVAFILVNNGTVKVHCESEKKQDTLLMSITS